MNAANEVAVAAFLAGRLPYLAIADTVEHTMLAHENAPVESLEQLSAVDAAARDEARAFAAAHAL
jgi:1-deoxy-D-xylulose-5-phosphate reductoisomerase